MIENPCAVPEQQTVVKTCDDQEPLMKMHAELTEIIEDFRMKIKEQKEDTVAVAMCCAACAVETCCLPCRVVRVVAWLATGFGCCGHCFGPLPDFKKKGHCTI